MDLKNLNTYEINRGLVLDDESENEVKPITESQEDEERPLLSQRQTPTSSWYLYGLAVVSSFGGILFGYDTGVINGAMLPLKREYSLSDKQQEIIVGITIAGAIVGSLLSFPLNNRFGRRPVLISSGCVFILGALLMSVASGDALYAMVVHGRLIVGVGIGFASTTVPVYIAEAAPANIRGTLVTVNQLMITLGICLASVINGTLSYALTEGSWRYMLGASILPAITMTMGMFLLPESPRWLLDKEREYESLNVLRKLRSDENVEDELDHIKQAIARNKLQDVDWKNILTTKHTLRALLIGCALQAFQQLSAINTVMYYSATIFQLAGVANEHTVIWLAAAVASANFIFTVMSMFFIERVGRRRLTLFSVFGIVVSLFLFAYMFHYLQNEQHPVTVHAPQLYADGCGSFTTCLSCLEASSCGYCFTRTAQAFRHGACLNSTYGTNAFCTAKHYANFSTAVARAVTPEWAASVCPTHYQWFPLLCMVFYVAMFACGMGPLPWAINSEIYPLWARSVGTSAATATNWTFNMIISLTFLDTMTALTQAGAFVLYGSLSLVGLLVFYLFLPETKGKRLEEIEELFKGPVLVPFKSK